jgi:hypothetical protein
MTNHDRILHLVREAYEREVTVQIVGVRELIVGDR